MRVLTFVVTCDYIDFWTLCFAHHFVYCCHFTRFLIKFFACLYLTTMQILWAWNYEYGVLFITHAREIFKSLVFDSWLENSSSICDEQNTILTFPPHSIYTLPYQSFDFSVHFDRSTNQTQCIEGCSMLQPGGPLIRRVLQALY